MAEVVKDEPVSRWWYHYAGGPRRPMHLRADGTIAEGKGEFEQAWTIQTRPDGVAVLRLSGADGQPKAELTAVGDGWRGQWIFNPKDPRECRLEPMTAEEIALERDPKPVAAGAAPLVVTQHQCPGDILCLTAALRDLKLAHPGMDLWYDGNHPALFENNPHVKIGRPPVAHRTLRAEYPGIGNSNQSNAHLISCFADFLMDKLGVKFRMTRLAPDLHLSEKERSLEPVANFDVSRHYWVLNAGMKWDFTLKLWPPEHWAKVIAYLNGRGIEVVQIGTTHDGWNPTLEGVVNLVGKTPRIRDALRLIYHAAGVLTHLSFPMHAAAAFGKPCVIPGGGREPPQFIQYPTQRYLHTVGMLDCCRQQACWKSRAYVKPGQTPDCLRIVEASQGMKVGQCMRMIQPDQVIAEIDRYYEHTLKWPAASVKKEPPSPPAAAAAPEARITIRPDEPPTLANSAAWLRAQLTRLPKIRIGEGRGIVTVAGGKYTPSGWVLCHKLRQLGCTLPIEWWALDHAEVEPAIVAPLESLGVLFRYTREHAAENHTWRSGPAGPIDLNGWESKPYAIAHSRFQEVLFLDADIRVRRDPSFLFESAQYREYGALFWPDQTSDCSASVSWKVCGLEPRHEPDMESGQMVIDKQRCAVPLALTVRMNEWSLPFFYDGRKTGLYGDKDTFRLAWHICGQPYFMAPAPRRIRGAFEQLWADGVPLFEHPAGGPKLKATDADGDGFLEAYRRCAALASARAAGIDDARVERLLEERCASRLNVFRHIWRWVRGIDAPRILETGCARQPDDWDRRPGRDDGAGFSTYLLGVMAQQRRGTLTSIDNDAGHIEFARKIAGSLPVNFVHADSRQSLREQPACDAYYLDSLDTYAAGFAEHGLAEFEAVHSALIKSRKPAVVAFDDTSQADGAWHGKGSLAAAAMAKDSRYQLVYRGPKASCWEFRPG